MTACQEVLRKCEPLNVRKNLSILKLNELKKECKLLASFSGERKTRTPSDGELVVYCAGSMGRRDMGALSDIDLFPITNKLRPSRMFELRVLAQLVEINDRLKYPPFSNYGEYLQLYSLPDLERATGSRRDDHDNQFTARLLMILESQPVFNEKNFWQF